MYESYKIEPGDTIQSVSSKFGVTIDDLFNTNNWSFINLQEGEFINIPYNKDNLFEKYTIVKGDTLYDIGKRYNISRDDLALLNGLEIDEYLYPNQIITVPKTGVLVYVTREDDTVKDIINKTNLKVDELFSFNENLKIIPDQIVVYKGK